MKIDENIFFREATKRICSSLELNKALKNSLIYLGQFMPVGGIFLYFYHYDTGILDVIAGVEINDRVVERRKIQFPPHLQKILKTEWIDQRIRLIERVGEHPISAFMPQSKETPKVSAIIMDMMLESQEVGVLSVTSNGKSKFTLDHVNLLKQLNDPFSIALTNGRRYQELLNIKNNLIEDNLFLKNELFRITGEEVIGSNKGLKQVMELVRQVAPSESPVLLTGETGTGKEVIAGAIHRLSSRSDGPLIKVNCGAIPKSLMDSELFGHEKGAFTGALSQKKGRFERANGGTIFLDEIGELHPEIQVRLLRVLQEKEIERLGGEETIRVDIRVIAATHQDLEHMLKQGTFREDLYFRLKVFPISIPPLRKRREDIPELLQYFIQKKCQEMKVNKIPPLAPGVLKHLMSYEWPGNIRELENAVEREIIINQNGMLTFKDIDSSKCAEMGNPVDDLEKQSFNLDEVMKNLIEKALTAAGGKVEGPQGAAELLSIPPWTLRHRMKKLGIRFGRGDRPVPPIPRKKKNTSS
jgi:transcriptional regulator with GAF, ATPase, and Fis domain